MTNLLKQIKENMDVYDAQEEKIGRVEFVQMAAAGTTPEALENTNLEPEKPRAVAAPKEGMAMLPDDDELQRLPKEVRERLLMHGFFKLDRPVLRPDALVMADSIADVRGERVILAITKDKLITV